MAMLHNPDGSHTVIEPKNKRFTDKELSDMIGTKNLRVTIPASCKSKIFIYAENEDDEVNVSASNRSGEILSGMVLECAQREVNFEN